ncbi:MAG: tripartite tricarboxylate transporter substrate binding protein [Burkholderiaceae bacterium]|nr:tripartite tricarboxylate transporter substrate binding protein [Burkholderiaceae bacterium]
MALGLSLGASQAWAQAGGPAWPTKPVRLVVAYPAGGVSDTVARALADKLAVQLATPVLIENKAGASGSLGVDAVAKAAPDGHTLGFAAISPLALNPHLGTSPFDPFKDIAPVVSVMYSPVLLLATPASKVRDFRDLLALARRQPGAVRWATSGQASLGHIMLEQIQAASRVQVTHIPYKGGGQQMNDALGGQFEVLSTNAGAAVLQHIQAGRLRPLAVGAPARIDSLPEVPTLAELGFPAANVSSLFGIYAPAKTPASVLERLNSEINQALAAPDLRSKLDATDNVPTGGKAADFARQIAQESENHLRIIRAAAITAH